MEERKLWEKRKYLVNKIKEALDRTPKKLHYEHTFIDVHEQHNVSHQQYERFLHKYRLPVKFEIKSFQKTYHKDGD